jgi:hypothetical protein
MSNTNQTEVNLPDFYDHYAKRTFWSYKEAVALSLNINPIITCDDSRFILIIGSTLEEDEVGKFYMKYVELLMLVYEALSYNIISSNMDPKYITNNVPNRWNPEIKVSPR